MSTACVRWMSHAGCMANNDRSVASRATGPARLTRVPQHARLAHTRTAGWCRVPVFVVSPHGRELECRKKFASFYATTQIGLLQRAQCVATWPSLRLLHLSLTVAVLPSEGAALKLAARGQGTLQVLSGIRALHEPGYIRGWARQVSSRGNLHVNSGL